jgi:glucokinase
VILGGDFGGMRTKLGLVADGIVKAETVIDSPAKAEASEWLPALKESAVSLCESAGVSLAGLEGMVWALPLIIDPGLRRATCSFGKFADTTRGDFCERAEELFGVPLLLENDARAAVIGEWQAGAGRGMSNLAMVTLGTGIGTGVIFEGQPLRGRSGMAGNLGGLSVTHLGTRGAGSVPPGCLEGRVATWALAERASGIPGFDASPLSGEARLDYEAVFSHAARGDSVACRLRDEALEAWGALALNLIQAYDPEGLIFGGGIMEAGDVILPAVREFVDRHAVQAGGPVEIKAGQLGIRAALIGCEWIWSNARIPVA